MGSHGTEQAPFPKQDSKKQTKEEAKDKHTG